MVGQVAGALDAAHAAGLVHRDVKPGNILVEGERCYLTDFGLTKTTQTDVTAMTATGVFLGTPDYAAPEQISATHVDGRADVYALGGVLYECLTGSRPFPRNAPVAVIYAQLHDAAAAAERGAARAAGRARRRDRLRDGQGAEPPLRDVRRADRGARAARDGGNAPAAAARPPHGRGDPAPHRRRPSRRPAPPRPRHRADGRARRPVAPRCAARVHAAPQAIARAARSASPPRSRWSSRSWRSSPWRRR